MWCYKLDSELDINAYILNTSEVANSVSTDYKETISKGLGKCFPNAKERLAEKGKTPYDLLITNGMYTVMIFMKKSLVIVGSFEIVQDELLQKNAYIWNICKLNSCCKYSSDHIFRAIILYSKKNNTNITRLSLNVDRESDYYDIAVKSYIHSGFKFSKLPPIGIVASVFTTRIICDRYQRMDMSI